jgi:hypothetical protein
MRNITILDLRETINREIESDKQDERIFNTLLPFIRENNGKPCDGWFKRRLEKAFPAFRLEFRAGMININCTPNETAHRSFIISYNGRVDLDVFIKNNTWAQESQHHRIEKNNAITLETLQKYRDALNKLNEAAEFLDSQPSFDIPVHFTFLRLIPWKIEKRRD